MKLRAMCLLAIFTLTMAAPASASLTALSEKGTALMKQGDALQEKGKLNEALNHFKQAALADPLSSEPVSRIAFVYFIASDGAPEKEKQTYRDAARAAAKAALKLSEVDPAAMEVLRMLDDDIPQQFYQPNAAAVAAMRQGEQLFNEQKYEAAKAHYQRAIDLDPKYTQAVMFLGDCYYMLGDMDRAVPLFRRATAMEPHYAVAWRFLFDALWKQGKRAEAHAAAIGALGAMPSQGQTWLRVRYLIHTDALPYRQFQLVKRAVLKDKQLEIDSETPESDMAAWMAYGLGQATAKEKAPKASAFELELAAWDSALQIINEAGKTDKLTDKGLRDMLAFRKAGQLKAAIFLLLYREAYRADFEAWKKAEPQGIARFLDTFHIGL